MKNIFIFSILLLILFSGCKTLKPVAGPVEQNVQTAEPVVVSVYEPVNYSDQTIWLLGYFNLSRLTQEPHSVWYIKEYDNYESNSEAVNRLLEISKEGLSIKIVMGTWCPDSRREVPRFMRILDLWKFPAAMVTFIGVDNAKLSPVGEYESLNIQRVPTFIILKNNIEAGRIIENPVTSLEQDIVNILIRNEK